MFFTICSLFLLVSTWRVKGNEGIAMKSISICKQDLVCGLTDTCTSVTPLIVSFVLLFNLIYSGNNDSVQNLFLEIMKPAFFFLFL
jgi:hypothetical protein